MGETTVFRIHAVRKSFGPVRVLDGVDLSIASGSVTVLMGANGAGKSTLVRIISGVYAADSGHIELNGQPFEPATPAEALRAGVVTVHQNINDGVVADLDVATNLTLDRLNGPGAGIFFNPRKVRREAREVAARMGLSFDMGSSVADLSLADRQMVAIARAMMHEPRLMILDEPTSSLSSRESETLFALIDRLKAKGTVILYVSHRLDEIFRLCDSLTVLRDGKLAAHHDDVATVTREQIISEMVGREISNIWNWRPRPLGDVRLEVKSLSGPRLAHPISFAVRRGEILGFFGLIGAGRSEMARLLYGADTRKQGVVTIDGLAVAPNNPAATIHAGMVLCPEDRKHDGIIQGRSIEENITISSRRHFSPFGILSPAREGALADRFIARLRVRTPSRHQDIINLSGGNQQKVILGRWLSEQGIKVLVIDEPTRGIDVGAKAEIYDILYELAAEGMAIVVISSELPEVMGISDRIVVMCSGRIAATVDRANFNEHSILTAALPDSDAADKHQDRQA